MDDPCVNFVQGSGPSTFIKIRSPNDSVNAKDVFTFCVCMYYICNVEEMDESSQEIEKIDICKNQKVLLHIAQTLISQSFQIMFRNRQRY